MVAEQHPWRHVPAAQWLDWRWQLGHALRAQSLAEHFDLDADTRQMIDDGAAFEAGVSPFFASLCDRHDPACPLRMQVVPQVAEQRRASFELADPLGEEPHRVAPGDKIFCAGNPLTSISL